MKYLQLIISYKYTLEMLNMAAPALLIMGLCIAIKYTLFENNNKKLYKMQKKKTSQKFVLIDGKFTPAEAKEVINYLLESKIQFHSRENFSSEIRYGKENEKSVQRRDQLQETKNNFSDFISEIPTGQQLYIYSVISIE